MQLSAPAADGSGAAVATTATRAIRLLLVAVLVLVGAATGAGIADAATAKPLATAGSDAAAQLLAGWGPASKVPLHTAVTAPSTALGQLRSGSVDLVTAESWAVAGTTAGLQSAPLATTSLAVVPVIRDAATKQLLPNLHVDGTSLAQLFAGHPDVALLRLHQLNPGVSLPTHLVALEPVDSAGTTAVFTSYLATTSPGAWGSGSSIPASASTQRLANSTAVATALAQQVAAGSPADTGYVGYLPTTTADASGLPLAAVAAGGSYLQPTSSVVASGSYPMIGTLDAYVASAPAAAAELSQLLKFAATSGQQQLSAGLAPLPASARARTLALATALGKSNPTPTPTPRPQPQPQPQPGAGGSGSQPGGPAGNAGGGTTGSQPGTAGPVPPAADSDNGSGIDNGDVVASMLGSDGTDSAPDVTADDLALSPAEEDSGDASALADEPLADGGTLPEALRIAVGASPPLDHLYVDHDGFGGARNSVPTPQLAGPEVSAMQVAHAPAAKRQYDLIAGVVVGFLVLGAFLSTVGYLRPARIGPPSPNRPRPSQRDLLRPLLLRMRRAKSRDDD